MTDPQPIPPATPALPEDPDAAFRQHLAKVIRRYTTHDGTVSVSEAYSQIVEETGRGLSTVKNWLTYKSTFVDVASLARIMRRWNIPPRELFPSDFAGLGASDGATTDKAERLTRSAGAVTAPDYLLMALSAAADGETLERMLAGYTDNPRSVVLMRHPGSEMLEQIRPGELMAVDTSCESIAGSGCYILRFSIPGQPPRIAVRLVDPLITEAALRLSGGNAAPTALTEMLPLQPDGSLPGHISVLGRVLGVLRRF